MQNKKVITNWKVAEIKVTYKPSQSKKIIKIENSKIAANVLRAMWDIDLINIQEQFCVLFLNGNSEVLGFKCLYTGSINYCNVDLRLLFSLTLKGCATSIIVAHNHPSGSLKPSQEDISITRFIKTLCDYFKIELMDHIILTEKAYTSMSDLEIL